MKMWGALQRDFFFGAGQRQTGQCLDESLVMYEVESLDRGLSDKLGILETMALLS